MPPVSTDDNQRRFADPWASGNALTEYGLLIGLVAVIAIAGLQLLGSSIRDQLIYIAGFEAKPASHQLQATNSGTAGHYASRRPTRGTFLISLGDGRSVFLENYPIDDYNIMSPTAINEQTEKIAEQMHVLAFSMQGEGVLSSAQAATISALSAQTHRIAEIQKPIEEARRSNTQNARMLLNSTITLDGRSYTLDQLAERVRAGDEAGAEMNRLRQLLSGAENSGALRDPVIYRMVTRMVERVEQVAQDLDQQTHLQKSDIDPGSSGSEKRDFHVIGGNG